MKSQEIAARLQQEVERYDAGFGFGAWAELKAAIEMLRQMTDNKEVA